MINKKNKKGTSDSLFLSSFMLLLEGFYPTRFRMKFRSCLPHLGVSGAYESTSCSHGSLC